MLAVATVIQACPLGAVIGIVALLPSVIQEYRISRAAAGVVATAPNLGLLLSLTLWGAAVDRIGSRATLGVAAILAGVLIAVASRMQSLALLTALLALTGAAAVVSFPAGGRMVARWFDEGRGLAMGINQAFVTLAGLVTALVLPNLLQLTILLGTPGFGWMADHLGGYSVAWTALAGVVVAAIAVLPAVRVQPAMTLKVGAHA